MNREEWQAIFNDKAKPLLIRFHQRALDWLGLHIVAFYVILAGIMVLAVL